MTKMCYAEPSDLRVLLCFICILFVICSESVVFQCAVRYDESRSFGGKKLTDESGPGNRLWARNTGCEQLENRTKSLAFHMSTKRNFL